VTPVSAPGSEGPPPRGRSGSGRPPRPRAQAPRSEPAQPDQPVAPGDAPTCYTGTGRTSLAVIAALVDIYKHSVPEGKTGRACGFVVVLGSVVAMVALTLRGSLTTIAHEVHRPGGSAYLWTGGLAAATAVGGGTWRLLRARRQGTVPPPVLEAVLSPAAQATSGAGTAEPPTLLHPVGDGENPVPRPRNGARRRPRPRRARGGDPTDPVSGARP
jgi:hypothetical protein